MGYPNLGKDASYSLRGNDSEEHRSAESRVLLLQLRGVGWGSQRTTAAEAAARNGSSNRPWGQRVLGAGVLQGNLLAPPLKKLRPMTARNRGSSRAPAASSTAATAGPFVSTCHVLASQPLMAAGSSSRFPGKPREDCLTRRSPSHSFPQFRGPTSGPDAPRLPQTTA